MKKGQAEVLQLSLLFEIIIAALVAGILIYSALNYSNFSKFNQQYAEEDLKRIVSAVMAAPGDVKIVYPISAQYEVQIKEGVDVKQSPNLLNDPFNKESALVIENINGQITINREALTTTPTEQPDAKQQTPEETAKLETKPTDLSKSADSSPSIFSEIPPISLNINLEAEEPKDFAQQIKCEHTEREGGCELKQSAYERLLFSVDYAKENYGREFHVTSAYRAPELQRKIFVDKNCNRKWVCGPKSATCSVDAIKISAFDSCPHTTGGAVDLCLESEKCSGAKPEMSDYYLKEDAELLEKIMCETGWLRYSAEWWHFEYGTARWKKTKQQDQNRCTLI
ncbi:hypothetical protein HY643_02845 [Candidatus Woesearchaeota archaeon]|nr:hypothetical protein [Candidatus Woesearchaeota archaeon]